MNLLMRRVDGDVVHLPPAEALARFPSRLSADQYREGEASGELCELEEMWWYLEKSLSQYPEASLVDVITGGDPVGQFLEDETVLAFVSPERTVAASAALMALDAADLRARMSAVVAENVNGEPPPGVLEHVASLFAEVTQLFRRAAEAGQGVLKNAYL